ncbi:PREDICTED: leucine-rich repeat-containing protein 27 [Calidris pugnax]|uniref:leucine-rich repeat-containing protein 27 n=1 Tax=Calidris pugnax TaxID=198806 RepID=UPI00071D4AC0|nr:PREDICTED: leucine-rich repeat-containing protein 27 [Calidris pugnax]
MDDGYSRELNSSGDNFGDEHLKKRNSSGSNSSKEIRKAVEECLLASSSTLDISRKNIKHLTEEIYRLPNIKHFHLEGNVVSTIPEDLFQKLPHLVWLDLRYNKIKALPPGIGYHRQLKTLLLERNPIKELPTELGNLTSLTALNLRHCPLEFPPKDVIQKGLKSILCFLRDSGNGKLHCTEPAPSGFGEPPEPLDPSPRLSYGLSAGEVPPIEKLNLSEVLQSNLDLSEEWPNEEEKLRFQKLKEEIIKDEECLADKHVGATQDFTEAGKRHRENKSAHLCSNKEMLQEWHSQAKLMKGKREMFRFSPANADTIPKSTPYAMYDIGCYAMKEGAEKWDRAPAIKEEKLLKVKVEAAKYLRELKLEQRLRQHMGMMKARGEKLTGTSQVGAKEGEQGIERVSVFSFSGNAVNPVLCADEHLLVAELADLS